MSPMAPPMPKGDASPHRLSRQESCGFPQDHCGECRVNTVGHPEVVADRILNFANVGENVIAGVDCGFGTFAGRVQVDTKIVWLKLQSLAEGARLASAQLWAKAA